MNVQPIKTTTVKPGQPLLPFLDQSLPPLREQSIVVITSKIVSVCQGRVKTHTQAPDKKALITSEVDYYIDASTSSPFDVMLTIKDDILIANGGIDESNGNGLYILWPTDLPKTTSEIWEHLRKKHGVEQLGVIVTDSRVVPMRWGTLGIGLSWCGFEPLYTYIGKPDIYGNNLKMTRASHIDGLAAAAVLVMGEGNEQTPLALISDVPFISFTNKPPSTEELQTLRITKEIDIYSPLTNSDKWKKGH